MSLTVVIVSHNSSQTLGACLERVRASCKAEIVVVDNASIDDSRAVAAGGGAKVIKNASNTGFGAAANLGAAEAGGDLLCFLNPDCFVDGELFQKADAAYAENSHACFVPGFTQGEDRLSGRQPGYSRKKLLADILETNSISFKTANWLKTFPDYHDHSWHWPLGTCLFISKTLFEEVGGFDSRYFVYMEDVEFGWQLSRHGVELRQIDHLVEHRAQEGADIALALRHQVLNEARLLYAKIHYGRAFALFLKLLLELRRFRVN